MCFSICKTKIRAYNERWQANNLINIIFAIFNNDSFFPYSYQATFICYIFYSVWIYFNEIAPAINLYDIGTNPVIYFKRMNAKRDHL